MQYKRHRCGGRSRQQRSSTRTTTVPILSNVLLTADESGIRVRATDLELTLEQSFPAEIAEHGAVTVPAKLFSGYLGNLPAGVLELSGSPTRASIKAERSNYDFLALPPDEYPPLPSAQKGASFAIAAKKFRDGVNSTIFAASSEEARGAVLMGTLLELEGASITLVATDGYRLAKWTGTLDRPLKAAPSTSFRRARWRRRHATSALPKCSKRPRSERRLTS